MVVRFPIFMLLFFCTCAVGVLLAPDAALAGQTASGEAVAIGRLLPLWAIVPFAGILLSIALFPVLAPQFWHHHFGKVAAFWSLLFALPFLVAFRETAFVEIAHIYLIDYIPFIILLWALFTISGGIVVDTTLRGKPAVNTVMLLIGAVLASWVGTTGASMVMIRPVLKLNRERPKKAHVICFFIFLVANIGGALTPLGDPPLFLGFLHQVPFFWVTLNILPHMLLTTALVLTIFFILDTYYYRKEKKHHDADTEENKKASIRIDGLFNLIFLAGVIGAILMSGYWKAGSLTLLDVRIDYQNLLRDGIIVCMGVLSLALTSGRLREANEFGWAPILEVAKLFAGIFITIIPALAILKAGSGGALAVLTETIRTPAHYFWISGGLSSFLDNAPTYLTFFNMALGKLSLTEDMVPAALTLGNVPGSADFVVYLKAVSAGSVFMGANTYIGNAPNFMVKSIAEEAGVDMPSFFGYMFKYAIPFLIPVFILVTFVFF